MTPALMRRVQPGDDAVECDLLGCRPTTERKHVGVVVFLGHPRGVSIVDQGTADARDLVGRDTGADAGATDDDADCSRVCHDLSSHGGCKVRVVDGVVATVGAQVLDFVALERQCMDEERLEAKSAVIGANNDLHVFTSV